MGSSKKLEPDPEMLKVLGLLMQMDVVEEESDWRNIDESSSLPPENEDAAEKTGRQK